MLFRSNKATNHFHSRYRSSFDAFLIDDVQYLAGKDRSEEEFFHTFNHLFGTHNQVVLTSDKPPKDLQGLEERLITRLQQGLVVDVKPPDLETRIAILKAKAEADDLYVPDEVCLMIAGHIRNNVRELEGALVRLSAEASINGTEITLDMAREALADLLMEGKNSNLSIESINKCVCQYFKITLSELMSKSRERKYSEPRQIAMYLMRKYTKRTLPDIAQAFGVLEKITKKMSITVAYFDTRVDESSVFTWKKGMNHPARRTCAGGTDFNAPTNWVNDPKRNGKFDVCLIITDGECFAPSPSRIRRGYLLVPGRKLQFETNDFALEMKENPCAKGSWR